MKAMIFDLDGTLYQTERIAVQAFQKTFESLLQQGMIETSVPSESKIRSVFGLTGDQFWRELLPNANDHVRQIADQLLLEYEKALIDQGKGRFYPGVTEGLKQLYEQGWSLFIVSNGIEKYVNAVLSSADLTRLFTRVCSLGDQPNQLKRDAVRILIHQYRITSGYMVGDRYSDIDAGIANGLKTIGCRYKGFPDFGKESELELATYRIDRFQDLFDVIKRDQMEGSSSSNDLGG